MWKQFFASRLKGALPLRRTLASNALKRLHRHGDDAGHDQVVEEREPVFTTFDEALKAREEKTAPPDAMAAEEMEGQEPAAGEGAMERAADDALAELEMAPEEDAAMSVEEGQTVMPSEVVTLKSLRAVAQRIAGAARQAQGYALVISADKPDMDISREVVQITREISDAKVKTLLLDRSESLHVISSVLGLPRTPGMKELLSGRASVEEVIKRDPESRAQFIAAGNPRLPSHSSTGKVGLEMMVDALNEVYDCVIIHADHATARGIFQQLRDYLSATVTIAETSPRGRPEAVFLGLEAAHKTVIRFERPQTGRRSLFGFRLPG